LIRLERKNKVVLRGDGYPEIGFGHLYRLIAVADMLQAQFDVSFALSSDSHHDIIPKRYPVTKLQRRSTLADEATELALKFKPSQHILILDGYLFDAKYTNRLKENGFSILFIDDLMNNTLQVDHLINHAINVDHKSYAYGGETIVHTGSKYALLRQAFLKSSEAVSDSYDCFICFGGSDVHQLSHHAAHAALNSGNFDNIHVVGVQNANNQLLELAEQNPQLQLHSNLNENELAKQMANSALAICSASTILYELCSLRVPTIAGYYADNQKNLYGGAVETGIAMGMGDISKFDSNSFTIQINKALELGADKFKKNQADYFDHRSGHRIQSILEQMSVGLSIKPCKQSDLDLVYQWSNDPLVRKNSYTSEPIEYEQHVAWFKQKLRSDKTQLFILMVNTVPAGLVRFELDDSHTVIGLLISQDFRGNGLASPMLDQACEYYFKFKTSPIWAYIKKSNIASLKSFKRANFEYLRDENVDGTESVVLQLIK
jgi:UDP-2,4-diacetamido-2,4,6-trideoxy-beta-L-altropyranose hydrolase